MGIVADVIMGLAGAISAVFLFNKTLELKFEAHQDTQAAIIIIGLSLVSGVFGRKMIQKAGEKLSEDDVKKISTGRALAVTGRARAQSLTQDAEDNIKLGVGIDRALEMSQAAVEADPTYIKAYITQGRALKRLNQLQQATEVMNKALSVEPGYPYALYNRACYGALLGHPADSVLADLEQAISALPKFAVVANTDEDFVSLKSNSRFAELVLQGATDATRTDSGYFEGHVAKADALKQLQRLDDALAAINQALGIKPNDPGALYKRASYSALLKRSKDEVVRDLYAAIKLSPELAKSAKKDPDFASLTGTPEFTQLLGSQVVLEK
jgi:tetratricopeptide (TPR) repeat protein